MNKNEFQYPFQVMTLPSGRKAIADALQRPIVYAHPDSLEESFTFEEVRHMADAQAQHIRGAVDQAAVIGPTSRQSTWFHDQHRHW